MLYSAYCVPSPSSSQISPTHFNMYSFSFFLIIKQSSKTVNNNNSNIIRYNKTHKNKTKQTTRKK